MRKLIWGFIMLAAGLLIWAGNYGILDYNFKFSRDWPILLIIWGVMKIWDSLSKPKSRLKKKDEAKIKKLLDEIEKGEKSVQDAIREFSK